MRGVTIAFAALALCIVATEAEARRGRLGRGLHAHERSTQPLLDVGQLTACLRTEAEIERLSSASMLEASYIEHRRALVRTSNDQDVLEFNVLVHKHGRKVREINKHVDGFNQSCAGREYYLSDMTKAKAELGRESPGILSPRDR